MTAMGKTIHLKKNSPAPYSGVLFTVDSAKKLKKELIQKDSLEKENQSLKRTITFKDLQIDNLDEQNTLYKREGIELRRKIKKTALQKYLYLGLGIVGTGLAVHLAGQLND